jgi:protein SCO1/2
MPTLIQHKNHNKLIFIILLIVAIFTTSVFYFSIIQKRHKKPTIQSVKIEGTFIPVAKEIADFQLTANNGKPFSKNDMKGHWTMMFFGFTNCGYVCPTTLAELNKMHQILKKQIPDQQLPQVVLVSVDPERDSVERMNDYVRAFNVNFIGARAEIKETEALENQLHISAIKMPAEGSNNYMVNHSAEIILFNPEAKIQAYFSFPPKSDRLAEDYRAILTATS